MNMKVEDHSCSTSNLLAQPLVSVIIPTIRGGHLLGEAVGSVLNQGIESLEIIIVTNRDGIDLSALPDISHVTVVHESIPVKAFAVNRGLLAAKGNWVAFLDDDDVWFQGKLAMQLEVLSSWKGSPACTTNFYVIDVNSKVLTLGKTPALSHKVLLEGKVVSCFSSLIVDREFLMQRGLLNCSYTNSDDFECLLRIARSGALAHLDQPLFGYRIHNGNSSRSNPEKHMLESLRAIADHRRQARIDRDWKGVLRSFRGTLSVRRFWAWSTLGQAHEAYKNRDFRLAATNLLLSVRFFPVVLVERLFGAEPLRLKWKS